MVSRGEAFAGWLGRADVITKLRVWGSGFGGLRVWGLACGA